MGKGVYLWEKMMNTPTLKFQTTGVDSQAMPGPLCLLSGSDCDVENGLALLTLPMYFQRIASVFSPKAVYNFENRNHFFHVLLKAVK